MDELDQQIQSLIEEAPDGVTGQTVEVLAPVLKTTASGLKRTTYYVLQTLTQGWVMTTLSSRQTPKVKKNVIYGFPTLKDAGADSLSARDPQLMALPTPVTHILFQMLALKSLDSIIFFETPGDRSRYAEIRRQDFQAQIQSQLKASQGYQDPYANIG